MNQLMSGISSYGWLFGILSVTCLLIAIYYGYTMLKSHASYASIWKNLINKQLVIAIFLLIALSLLVLAIDFMGARYENVFGVFGLKSDEVYLVIKNIISVLQVLTILWIVWTLLNILNDYVQKRIVAPSGKIIHMIYPVLSNCLRFGIILIVANILISEDGFIQLSTEFLQKLSVIFLILLFWYGFVQLLNILEKVIISQYMIDETNSLTLRKINTQVSIIKRILLIVGTLIFIAFALLVFKSVRTIGAGLLTTAGVVGAIGAFASQQSLVRIFAGLQIAFTQPARIGDTVIINNEFGEVEEISLSYVVIKTWDFRRLILPTDYINTHGLQNLSRTSTQLLGTIFLYVDYTIPIDIVREQFLYYLKESTYWDKSVGELQVTETKEQTMELRATVSASNPANLWNLRCELREKLIQFIVRNYPECLPKFRICGKH